MSDFPLSPFLASLATDGIQLTISDYARLHHVLQTGGDWTITRLRDTLLALLAHDADQQELFLRRFNDFFVPSLPIDETVAALDVRQVLADLKKLPTEKTQFSHSRQFTFKLPKLKLPTLAKLSKAQFWFWIVCSVLLVSLSAASIGYVWLSVRQIFSIEPFPISTLQAPAPVIPTASEKISATPTIVPISQQPKRLYTDVPYAKITYEPLTTFEAWQYYAGSALFLLFATLLYGFYLWRVHKIPEDVAPAYNPAGPRHFPLGAIGGQPAPLLDDAILNELADCMGYFQSEEGGHMLDVPTSIQATMRKGGVPALTFHKRQQLRSLLILEDDFAEPLTWNSLALELAAGMTRLGVSVVYGRFHGSPAQFKTTDGVMHRLEDLEDQRRGYLLLIFTDGKSLQRQGSTFALESLAHWPMVAWMELREPRAWDESTMLPTHYGIPLYPATPSGALKAVRRFLTEHGAAIDYARNGHSWRGLPRQIGTKIDAYIEQLLGDALLWAQDCAMFQPISPGLADALRRTFYSHLPAERIERLYGLPDTQYDVAGLRFSADVLRVLRNGFLARRTEVAQEKVLRFLIQAIEKTEPLEENSLAHLAWEAVKERVRLELEQDAALARLAQLAQTPVGPAISISLEGYGFHDDKESVTPKIPLRLKPKNRYAWQRLARITDSVYIPKQEAYPIAWGHWTVVGILILTIMGCGGLSLANYLSPSLPNQNWRATINIDKAYALLESKDITTGQWNIETLGELHELTALALRPGREYQSILYGEGYRTINPFFVKNHQMAVISVQVSEATAICQEELRNIGLTVERCAHYDNYHNDVVKQETWQHKLGNIGAAGRLMSIGIEVADQKYNNPKLRDLHNLLLSTSSIDVLYSIHPDNNGDWHIDQAFHYIREDLGPLIEKSQLIWWATDQSLESKLLKSPFPKFERVLRLSNGKDLTWLDILIKLFEPTKADPLTEKEIIQALSGHEVKESDSDLQIILIHSPSVLTDTHPPTTMPRAATSRVTETSESAIFTHTLNSVVTADIITKQLTGSILYSTYEEREYKIYQLTLTGTVTVSLLVVNGSQPRLALDGKTLAFHSMPPDAEGLSGWTLNSNLEPTDRSVRYDKYVEDSKESPPDWSPTREFLTFASRREGDRVSRIYLKPAFNTPNYSFIFGEDPSWQPNGNTIVYKGADDTGNQPGLWLVSNFGQSFRDTNYSFKPLTNVATDRRPTWSPDGKYVAFMSNGRDGNWEIYRATVANGDVKRLTNDPGADGLPTVSPDGKYVAFVSNRGGSWAIWAVPIDGGQSVLIGPILGSFVYDDPSTWLENAIQWVK